ncbi:unnamed protein product [Amoebophrya sp. A120]|nr:unnamed protein product [Amoebophrya sp. A120]|eukprot:GSA120T00005848001.1
MSASASKTFAITGGFPSIRKQFEVRGWKPDDEPDSSSWDLKYTIRKKDIDFNALRDLQVVNYFPTNHEFTTKISLTNNLWNLCWMDPPEAHEVRIKKKTHTNGTLEKKNGKIQSGCNKKSVTDRNGERLDRGFYSGAASTRTGTEAEPTPEKQHEDQDTVCEESNQNHDKRGQGEGAGAQVELSQLHFEAEEQDEEEDNDEEITDEPFPGSNSAIDVDTFYPRCFNLNNDTDAFIEDFKRGKCLAVLKTFLQLDALVSGGMNGEEDGSAEDEDDVMFDRDITTCSKKGAKPPNKANKGGAVSSDSTGGSSSTSSAASASSSSSGIIPEPVVHAALEALERKLKPIDDCLDDDPTAGTDYVTKMPAEFWDKVQQVNLDNPAKHLPKYTRRRTLACSLLNKVVVENKKKRKKKKKRNKNSSTSLDVQADDRPDEQDATAAAKKKAATDELRDRVLACLAEYAERDPQFHLYGDRNLWILKPAGKSRGRGIFVTDRLEEALDCQRGQEALWMAQKYIENPQIIEKKKFDIRQWVCITTWQPLGIWFFDQAYLRFSFDDYDKSDVGNRFAHLTNNSVAKYADRYDEGSKDSTMITSAEYSEFLAKNYPNSEGKIMAAQGGGAGTVAGPTFSEARAKVDVEGDYTSDNSSEHDDDESAVDEQVDDASSDASEGIEDADVLSASSEDEEGEDEEEVDSGSEAGAGANVATAQVKTASSTNKSRTRKATSATTRTPVTVQNGAPSRKELSSKSANKCRTTTKMTRNDKDRGSPSKGKTASGGRPFCLWRDKIQPQMERIAYLALASCQDRILLADRRNCFELVGFDFMVDENFNVWLIECNSSPDLSYSTSTTKQLVKEVLSDLVGLILDAEKFPRDASKKGGNLASRKLKKSFSAADDFPYCNSWKLLYPELRRKEQKLLGLLPSAEEVRAHLVVTGVEKKLHKSKKKLKSLAVVVRNLLHGRNGGQNKTNKAVDDQQQQGTIGTAEGDTDEKSGATSLEGAEKSPAKDSTATSSADAGGASGGGGESMQKSTSKNSTTTSSSRAASKSFSHVLPRYLQERPRANSVGAASCAVAGAGVPLGAAEQVDTGGGVALQTSQEADLMSHRVSVPISTFDPFGASCNGGVGIGMLPVTANAAAIEHDASMGLFAVRGVGKPQQPAPASSSSAPTAPSSGNVQPGAELRGFSRKPTATSSSTSSSSREFLQEDRNAMKMNANAVPGAGAVDFGSFLRPIGINTTSTTISGSTSAGTGTASAPCAGTGMASISTQQDHALLQRLQQQESSCTGGALKTTHVEQQSAPPGKNTLIMAAAGTALVPSTRPPLPRAGAVAERSGNAYASGSGSAHVQHRGAALKSAGLQMLAVEGGSCVVKRTSQAMNVAASPNVATIPKNIGGNVLLKNKIRTQTLTLNL